MLIKKEMTYRQKESLTRRWEEGVLEKGKCEWIEMTRSTKMEKKQRKRRLDRQKETKNNYTIKLCICQSQPKSSSTVITTDDIQNSVRSKKLICIYYIYAKYTRCSYTPQFAPAPIYHSFPFKNTMCKPRNCI